MRLLSYRIILQRTAATLIIILSLGCENTIEPYSGRAQPYSVYGVLSLNESRHFIRVRPTEYPVTTVPKDPLPVKLQLENLSTGETHQFQDSVITFGEANTHNYWAEIDLRPETKYRLVLKEDNGPILQTTNTSPTDTKATIDPHNFTPAPPSDTVHVNSDSLHCRTTFTVSFRDAQVPYRAALGLELKGEQFWVDLPIRDLQSQKGVKGLHFQLERLLGNEFEVDKRDDYTTCRYYETRCPVLTSSGIRVAYTYLSPTWFGNRPSADSLLNFNPTESRKIRGGLGFFGTYNRDTLSTAISRGVIDLTPDACTPL